MQNEKHDVAPVDLHHMAAAKYLSSVEISHVLRLLAEVRDVTLSRASHTLGTQLIAKLGYDSAQPKTPS